MRAAVYHGPHDIRIEDVPEPGEPGPGQVVLASRRVALCGTDAAEWEHGPRLTRPPVILGHEVFGVVEAVGPGVSGFVVGDRVVTGAGVWCGACDWCRLGRTNLCASYATHGLSLDGGLAGWLRVPSDTLVKVPDDVTDDAAALAQPLAVAIHAVRRAEVHAGDIVVVIGVGGIGAFIVAAASARAPRALIAIDIDPHRLSTATRLGATRVGDASGQDLVTVITELTADEQPHVIIEASGAPGGPAAATAAVRKGGRVAIVGLQAGPRELDLFSLAVREVDVTTTVAHVCRDDLPAAVGILATQPIAETVIEKVIGLDDLVPGGIMPLVNRTATGKIVVDPIG
jgi:threonine dehydrogenase-like Zn-dependent dehydrogenase